MTFETDIEKKCQCTMCAGWFRLKTAAISLGHYKRERPGLYVSDASAPVENYGPRGLDSTTDKQVCTLCG